MNNGTKRTLAELITLHELEPELSEVITEGREDSAVILWFLRRSGSNASVYSIADRLDVPAAEVRRRGQNVGAKGRVITAAISINEQSPSAAERVTFIYDVDDDAVTGRSMPTAPNLLHTDYASMEMYCFNKLVIEKLLSVTLRAPEDIDPSGVLDAIRESLVECFFARLVLNRQSPPIGMIPAIERRCRLTGDNLVLNTVSLITDCVNRAGGARALGVSILSLVADQQREMANCPTEIRLAIRGHDFTRLCCFYLKTRYPSLFRDDRSPYKVPAVFERVLVTCLESSDLASEPLFRELSGRYGISKAVGRTG